LQHFNYQSSSKRNFRNLFRSYFPIKFQKLQS
jgi:hypothetical protein